MPDPTRRSTISTVLLLAVFATAALGLALARGWQPGIPGEWVWRRNDLPIHLWGALAAGLGIAALSAVLCRTGVWTGMSRASRSVAFIALILLVFVFQMTLLNAIGLPWVTPGAYIISPNATTYYAVSLGVTSPSDWLTDYPELLATLPHHAATHPPGFVLFFWLMRKVGILLPPLPSPALNSLVSLGDTLGMTLTRADATGAVAGAFLIALIGSLGLIPLYLLIRSLAGQQTAICATCLAGATPALALLGASPDLIVMTLAVCTLAAGYAGYRGGWAWGLFAGITAAIGMFLSLAFALIALWAVIWAAFEVGRSLGRSAAIQRVLRVAVAAAAAFTAIYVVLYLVAGYRPIAVAIQALSAHRGVTMIEEGRTYWKWALMNPVECAVFAGIPAIIAALSLPGLRRPSKKARLRESGAASLPRFLAAWLILFLLLDLSGVVRGEVGRIWLFLLWPVAMAAGTAISNRADAGRTTALLVLMQVAQALMMKAYLTIYSIL